MLSLDELLRRVDSWIIIWVLRKRPRKEYDERAMWKF